MKKVLAKYSIFMLLVIIVNFLSCGVKGNPIIAKNVHNNVPIVQNLKAIDSGNEVLPIFDVNSKDSKFNYVATDKFELGSAGKIYKRIVQIPMNEINEEDKEYNSFRFTNNNVAQERYTIIE